MLGNNRQSIILGKGGGWAFLGCAEAPNINMTSKIFLNFFQILNLKTYYLP